MSAAYERCKQFTPRYRVFLQKNIQLAKKFPVPDAEGLVMLS